VSACTVLTLFVEEQDPMDVDDETELASHQVYEIVAASHNPMPRTEPDL